MDKSDNKMLTLRVCVLLFAGRFGGSWELSELGESAIHPVLMQSLETLLFYIAYSISNLYSLGNDYIVTKKCPASSKISKVYTASYIESL